MKHCLTSLIFFIVTSGLIKAQDTTDYYIKAVNLDFSSLWTSDNIADNEGKSIQRQTMGFIGENYQRLYIRFISVIQNKEKPYEYYVYGKTKVKNNICEFQGLLEIKGVKVYIHPEFPNLKTGFINGVYQFFENKNQQGTGIFKGIFTLNWYIDSKGDLRYDALMFDADGYRNNQFEGTWTSYKGGQIKKCNWGDFRIPDCGDLDKGEGEFYLNEKYSKFGWESYSKILGDSPENQKAREMENQKWWK